MKHSLRAVLVFGAMAVLAYWVAMPSEAEAGKRMHAMSCYPNDVTKAERTSSGQLKLINGGTAVTCPYEDDVLLHEDVSSVTLYGKAYQSGTMVKACVTYTSTSGGACTSGNEMDYNNYTTTITLGTTWSSNATHFAYLYILGSNFGGDSAQIHGWKTN